MKKIRNLLLGFMTLSLLVSGCSNVATPNNGEPNNNTADKNEDLSDEQMIEVLSNWEPKINFLKDDNYAPTFDEMSAVPNDEQDRLSSTLFDVERGSSILIKLIDESFSASTAEGKYQDIVSNVNSSQYISVSDVDGHVKDAALSTDGTCIDLAIDNSYNYGSVYVIELVKENVLYFDGKDPSIQKLTLEIIDDPTEAENYDIVNLKPNIPQLDLANVSDEHVDENATFTFTYSGSLPTLNPGDIFLVKNNQNDEKLEITDFYGKFVSKEDLGNNKYKVTYVEPEGSEIYSELRKKGTAPLNLEGNIKPLYEDEGLINSLRYSSFARGFLNFYHKYSGVSRSELLGNILDQVKLDITYNYYDNKLTFTLSIHIDQIKLSDTLYLSLGVKYTEISFFDVDFDIGIKTKWLVPVGISYKLKMQQSKQQSFEFDISIKKEKPTEPSDEEEIKNTLYDELQKAKDGYDNFYQRLKDDAKAVAQTEGNKTTIPLFSVTCPLYPPVVFEFKIDFIIDLSVQAMLVIKKQWESNTTFFNYSNQKGGDGDTSQNITKATFWDVYLMGKIELTFSLRIAGALYIEGTYKFCHVEVYIELYVKIGIQGVLMASFPSDTDASHFNGNVTIDLYVLMGAKVGLEIVIAFFSKDFSRDIFKTYMLRIVFTNGLSAYLDSAPTSITMNKSIMSIDETDVLSFRTWNGVTMRAEDKKLKASDVTTLIESWVKDLKVRIFSFEAAKPEWVEISEDGVIRIKDDDPDRPADLTTTFKIKVNIFAGIIADREITLTYHDPDAHHIYIDGNDMGRFSKNNTYYLPEPKARDGYKFLYYHYPDSTVEMHVNDPIVMGDEDINIVTEWHKIIYYTVFFYDGFNNLIHVDSHVEEFTAVTPPDPEIRDQYMHGYFFLGWDKKIDCITSDLAVHGLYMKVGD